METVLTEVGLKGTLPGLVFRAVRDIAPGEELSVPYYHPADYVSQFHVFTTVSTLISFMVRIRNATSQ
jgi:hypothetical protein